MPAIRLYETSLCENGVCGPDMDQSLVDVSRPDLGLSEKSGGCCGGSTSCC